MASRSAIAPVVIVVLLLVALAVFAPFLAKKPALSWLPSLSANPKNNDNSMTVRVWVNRRSGFYYCRASKAYGRIHPGFIIRQGHALERGYRPAEGTLCP